MHKPATKPPDPSRDRRLTYVLLLAAASFAVMAMLAACGGEGDERDDDMTSQSPDERAPNAMICLVKQTPPGQPPQPLPPSCSSK